MTSRPSSRSRSRAAALALRESEQRLRAIVNTAVEGIVTIDEQGRIDTFNPAAERIFGYRAAEIIGQNVNRLMPSPHAEGHDDYLRRYLRTGQARIIGLGREVIGQRKDGTVFPMDLSVSEVRLGRRRLFTGIIRDVTERKRLEREVLEISAREQRRIGHDLHDGLGQHLAGIELLSQVLEQRLARRSKAEAAKAAEIARLVREAIAQTRALARGLSPVEADAAGLMAALGELARTTGTLFRVRSRFECPRPVVLADESFRMHLYRIAQEAVGNALKHGQAKHITIRLDRQRAGVCLTVSDDGLGLRAAAAKSAGMGWRIMKYRAGMMGGVLEIRPGAPSGTVVSCLVKNGS